MELGKREKKKLSEEENVILVNGSKKKKNDFECTEGIEEIDNPFSRFAFTGGRVKVQGPGHASSSSSIRPSIKKVEKEGQKKKKDFYCTDGVEEEGYGRRGGREILQDDRRSKEIDNLFSRFAFTGGRSKFEGPGRASSSSSIRPSIKKVEKEEGQEKKKDLECTDGIEEEGHGRRRGREILQDDRRAKEIDNLFSRFAFTGGRSKFEGPGRASSSSSIRPSIKKVEKEEGQEKKKDFECTDGIEEEGHGRNRGRDILHDERAKVNANFGGEEDDRRAKEIDNLFSRFAFTGGRFKAEGPGYGSSPSSSSVRPSINKVEKEEREKKKKKKTKSPQLTASQKRDVAYLRRSPDNTWVPPKSPHRLLQENHFHDPWRVVVICMLLNRTSGVQVSTLPNKLVWLFQLPKRF